MSNVDKVCESCGRYFYLKDSDIKYFNENGYVIPNKCWNCRQLKKEQGKQFKVSKINLHKEERKPLLIGFFGRRESGKTTSADYLVNNYGAKKFSFASPLKNIAKDLFNIETTKKEDKVEGTNLYLREIYQKLGQAIRTHLQDSTFVDKCLGDIKVDYTRYKYNQFNQKDFTSNAYHSSGIYVIDDVRYPNEVAELVNSTLFEPYVIKINRLNYVRKNNSFDTHESESSIESVPDKVIYATIEAEDQASLTSQLSDIFKRILG